MYLRPRPLHRAYRTDEFRSGSTEQSTWLREHARREHESGASMVIAVVPNGGEQVVGFYEWSMVTVGAGGVSAGGVDAGGSGEPASATFALVSRLAVDQRHEGRGLGHSLLADAVQRATDTARGEAPCAGLLLHVEDETARAFAMHALPALRPSPTDPMHLMLLAKDLLVALAAR